MEEMLIPGTAANWNYQERIMELMLSLRYTKSELECTKIVAMEERTRNEEHINKLVESLSVTRRERDEARKELQGLMEKMIQTNPTRLCDSLVAPQPDTPPMQQTKVNSSIMESLSYVSSPIESIFETVSSPEFSNMADSSNISMLNQSSILEYEQLGVTANMTPFDNDLMNNSRTITSLSKRKSLPEKGKLLQAVMEAGPLLQTLLVAGPLPQWKTPPPPHPLQIPPISTKVPSSATSIQNPNLDPISRFHGSSSLSINENFCDASQIYSSLLHCQNPNNSWMQKRPALSDSVGDHFGKAQRSKGKHRKLQ